MIEHYLNSYGYELVAIEDGMVYYRDTNGRVWGAREDLVAIKAMKKVKKN